MGELESAREQLHRFAIEEGVRVLETQRLEVETIRTRAVALLGLIATASAFLIGAALASGQRGGQFYVPLAVGTAFFVVLLGAVMYILHPIARWNTKVSPIVIVDDFANDGSLDAYRQLAKYYDLAREANEPKLELRRTALQVATFASGLLIITWMILVWLVAS